MPDPVDPRGPFIESPEQRAGGWWARRRARRRARDARRGPIVVSLIAAATVVSYASHAVHGVRIYEHSRTLGRTTMPDIPKLEPVTGPARTSAATLRSVSGRQALVLRADGSLRTLPIVDDAVARDARALVGRHVLLTTRTFGGGELVFAVRAAPSGTRADAETP